MSHLISDLPGNPAVSHGHKLNVPNEIKMEQKREKRNWEVQSKLWNKQKGVGRGSLSSGEDIQGVLHHVRVVDTISYGTRLSPSMQGSWPGSIFTTASLAPLFLLLMQRHAALPVSSATRLARTLDGAAAMVILVLCFSVYACNTMNK